MLSQLLQNLHKYNLEQTSFYDSGRLYIFAWLILPGCLPLMNRRILATGASQQKAHRGPCLLKVLWVYSKNHRHKYSQLFGNQIMCTDPLIRENALVVTG
jgi:hypothetical protein